MIPFDNETRQYSRCLKYDLDFSNLLKEYSNGTSLEEIANVGQNGTMRACDSGWHYELKSYTTSVVSDWDLVCDRSFLPTLALVLVGVSGLVGSYVFGYIQDGYGRRPAFFVYLAILCVFSHGTSFAGTFSWWLLCRIGVGFTIPSVMMTPFVLSIELVGVGKRNTTTIVMNLAYSFSLVLLSGAAYLFQNWRWFALLTAMPFLAFFSFWWFLPESPRWLVANRRYKEAEKILKKMAAINKTALPEDYFANVWKAFDKDRKEEDSEDASTEGRPTYGPLDLFKTPNLRKKSAIITFIWFVNTAVYVGLSYYAPALGGNAYWNFFLASCAELPTYFFLWPSIEYWGRRWTLCISMIIGGVACVATVLSQEDQKLTLILYCIGKFGISASFVVLPLMASELYPTVIRGIGLSISSVAGMIGPVVIPLINYLGEDMMVLPLIIMGFLLVFGGLLAVFLPETLNTNLPETLEEGENFGKDRSWNEFFQCCPRRGLRRRRNETEDDCSEKTKIRNEEMEMDSQLLQDHSRNSSNTV